MRGLCLRGCGGDVVAGERDSGRQLVRGSQRGGITDPRQHDRGVGLVRRLLDPAGAHQRVGEREGEVGFVRRVVARVLQHADRFVKPSGTRQCRCELILDHDQLRVRVHNRLQDADARRVFLLADQ